jgi:di/tripeptidase
MNTEKLNRLKEVLSVPTHSRNEVLMIEYLKKVLTEKGYDFTVDSIGNIYVTKGVAEWYPCFVAHTDTVHRVNPNLRVVELTEGNKTILTGIDSVTMKPSGIGGDDKCGVFLCLEMLDTLDNVKVALFVSEEIGCIGSKQADPEFFKNVGYAIQYDSPEGDSMSMTLMGKQLFGKSSDFGTKVGGLIKEHGITSWERHPYTDIWPLMEKFGFSCLNLAAGYHRYHTDNEYVVVEEVENSFNLGLKLHEILGENFYERIEDKLEKPKYQSFWGGYYSNPKVISTDSNQSQKTILTEDEDDEDEDYWFEWHDEWEDFNKSDYEDVDYEDVTDKDFGPSLGGKNEFVDLFDYKEFNGGYSIRNFGSSDEHDYRYDW